MASGDNAPQVSGLEKFYRDNFVIGIVLSVCCGIIGLVLSAITFFTAKDPTAKKNAMICMIIPIALTVIYFVLNLVLGIGLGVMGK